MSFDLFDELIKIKENYRDSYGLIRKRSKYLNRAYFVLFRQRIYKPPPKFIVDREDLPREALFDPYLDLKVKDVAQRLFVVINENVYNDVKDLIRTDVQ